jgi:hypothetical protein
VFSRLERPVYRILPPIPGEEATADAEIWLVEASWDIAKMLSVLIWQEAAIGGIGPMAALDTIALLQEWRPTATPLRGSGGAWLADAQGRNRVEVIGAQGQAHIEAQVRLIEIAWDAEAVLRKLTDAWSNKARPAFEDMRAAIALQNRLGASLA